MPKAAHAIMYIVQEFVRAKAFASKLYILMKGEPTACEVIHTILMLHSWYSISHAVFRFLSVLLQYFSHSCLHTVSRLCLCYCSIFLT